MTDAANTQPGDTAATGNGAVPEMASSMPSDGMELIPEIQSPESTDSAPQESGTKDWEREAKTWQGRYDKNQERFKGVGDALEKHGIDGQTASNALDQYDLILKNEALAPLVNEFLRTGRVSTSPSKTPEEIEDELFEKPWLADLNEMVTPLQEENRALRARLNGVQRNTGAQAVEKQVDRFLKEYPLNEEERQEFGQGVDQWMRNVTSDAGIEMLQDMTWENFKKIGVSIIEKWRPEIEARRAETKRQGLGAMATDAPSRVSTTGAEPVAIGPAARTKEQVKARARAAAAKALQKG